MNSKQSMRTSVKRPMSRKFLHASAMFTAVSKRMGRETTRGKLLKLVNDIESDSENVQLKLVGVLQKMIPLFSGPDIIYLWLEPLKKLGRSKSASVRKNAAEVLNKIIFVLNIHDVEQYVFPVVFRFASSAHSTDRVIACEVLQHVYRKVNSMYQLNIRGTFFRLCQDPQITVRIAAVAKLGEMASVMSKKMKAEYIIPLFIRMANDKEYLIRRLVVGECCSVASNFKKEEIKKLILPTYEQFAADESWRVRLMVAETIIAFQYIVGEKLTMYHLLHVMRMLLKDKSPDVRAAAAGELADFSQRLDPTYRSQLIRECVLPVLTKLCSDSFVTVRKNLPSLFISIGRIDKELFMEDLLELFSCVVNDDELEVQQEAVKSVTKFAYLFEKEKVLGKLIDTAQICTSIERDCA